MRRPRRPSVERCLLPVGGLISIELEVDVEVEVEAGAVMWLIPGPDLRASNFERCV